MIEDSLINIYSNAKKSIPNFGKIETTIYSFNKTVFIEISDDGIGIPEEKRNSIFELGHSYWPDGSGSGYGLWRSKKIIEANHGQIEYRPNTKKGSTFAITLPIYGQHEEGDDVYET
jgi:signal transduction histidine kinase